MNPRTRWMLLVIICIAAVSFLAGVGYYGIAASSRITADKVTHYANAADLTGSSDPDRAKEMGRSAVCLNNLHQIGIALQLFVQDNQNKLPVIYDQTTNHTVPAERTINVVLLPYVSGLSNIFRCPSENRMLYETTGSSYAWNVLLNGQDADHLEMFTNAYPVHQIFIVFNKEKFHLARGDRWAINYLYADGHIKNLMELQSLQ